MTENKTKMSLKLPRMAYGTICLKILKEFMEYHKIGDMPCPEGKEPVHEAMEKIFNIMLGSIEETKREAIIKDAIAYYHDLPPNVR
jgi:hypothetical protein